MKPLVILELANNHMGDIKHASLIINSYHKITKQFTKNIDFAIKFQHRDLKTYIHENIKKDDKRVSRFTSTELSESTWKKLINLSKKNFKVICTPFSEKSVDWVCKKNFDYLKIASCSFNDWPLLREIKKKKIKIICSLGGGTVNDISKTISFLSKKDIKYLYCVGMYPTKTEDINLSYFLKLKQIFGECIAGFSSHEKPDEELSGALAYGMGARIFEKHINIESKRYKINEYSVTPDEFKRWLENLNHSILLNGSVKKRDKNIRLESKYIGNFKRGVFLKKNSFINKGSSISLSDVDFKFPAEKNQLLANDFSKFISIKSKKKLSSLQPVMKSFCEIHNSRIKIEKIRDQIQLLINRSLIIVPKKMKLEISYHYGLENFKKTGMCMLTLYNSDYCKKILFLLPYQSHPAQFHNIKKETFFVIFGKIEILINGKKKILKKGEMTTILPKQTHSFRDISGSGAVIEELSTQSYKEDSYYHDKSIEKNKKRKSFISLIE
tara:strand:- start:6951 stop:8441 length:1491 start_codon:yes stop_codon:yes gene_type:complete